MTVKINCGLAAFRLLTLCELTLSAMVLPRPPSSPNDIPRETLHDDNGKFGHEKTLYNLVQLNTNVEKPNTDGYRLLEIELGGGGLMDETNIRGIVRAMLSSEENDNNQRKNHEDTKNDDETYPNPEVIPNSILGVRDIGLTPNYRFQGSLEDREDEKRQLESSKDHSINEKLYYLKSKRPKVDVNVRGNSGSFVDDAIVTKTFDDRITILRPPGTYVNTKSLSEKRIRRPKKYQRWTTSHENNHETKNSSSVRIYGIDDYDPRPDSTNDESTTENMSVTSSELPKQIPAPPSRHPSLIYVAQTTPVQKYSLRRTDILPGYGYGEA